MKTKKITFNDNTSLFEFYEIVKEYFDEELFECGSKVTMRFFPTISSENVKLYEKEIKIIEKFLTGYRNLYKSENLYISNCYVDSCNDNAFGFCIHVGTGQNGRTQFSTQSLNYIMDITHYMENHFGARCYISSTTYGSDMLSYVLYIVIWKDVLESEETGNLKPLYYFKSNTK